MRIYSLVVISILIYCTEAFSQVNSGEVIYGITKNVSTDTKELKDFGYENFKSKVYNIIPTLEFVLEFNRNKSLFFLEKSLSIDLTEFYTKTAVLIVKGNKVFYTDLEKELLFEQTTFMNEELTIESSLNDLKWELTRDSKKIGEYLCYKAVTSKKIFDKNNEEISYFFTAWYCPEIPFQYGPFEFNNLPGMILELSNKEFIYSAKKVILNDKLIEIDAQIKGKIITREEYDKMGKKMLEKHRN
jgi:GLPGLI family protein